MENGLKLIESGNTRSAFLVFFNRVYEMSKYIMKLVASMYKLLYYFFYENIPEKQIRDVTRKVP